MTFTRTTTIDASPTGDSVKQAILDLDLDLTAAFTGLNSLLSSLNVKIAQADYNQPLGVPRLDSGGLIPRALLPSTLADAPIGKIAEFGMEVLPADSNWLFCDGSEVAIADYGALYAAIGTKFGLPVDPAKFKLPDLRGVFLRGWNSTAGASGDPDAETRVRGNTVGSYQADGLGPHVHGLGAVKTENPTSGAFNESQVGSGGFATTAINTAQTGGTETRPRNVAVMYCIKWR